MKPRPPGLVRQVVALGLKGLAYRDISERVERSVSVVGEILNSHGFRRYRERGTIPWDQVRRRRENGETLAAISRSLAIPYRSLSRGPNPGGHRGTHDHGDG